MVRKATPPTTATPAPAEKNKGGRPAVVFDEQKTNMVRKLAAFMTVEQMADFFEISENTLSAVFKRQPEVSVAYKRGRAEALAAVASGLLQRAREGDNACTFFYLKTQWAWRETATQAGEGVTIVIDRPIAKADPDE